MSKETTRKCIVTGQLIDKEQLLRFTILPDNTVVPDFKKKLPGKGFYTLNSRSVLLKAINNNLFAKASKSNAKVSLCLIEQVEHILNKQALDIVSLARKAGILILGMDKVKEAIKKGNVAFLHEAINAGEDGHNKILTIAKNIEIFNLFKIEELDKELARENTVHLAFVKSNMAQSVRETFVRLTSFLNN
ncbi:MAG: DUF448 domain-containing protein [Alphaproteobacteria bacterium]|nr:DUF448 domain-containing protein [Alphaproteobacteria bacterium]